MYNFVYPAKLTPDKEDGGFVVTFIDFPEAITQGDTQKEALKEAIDCLEEAVANRIVMKSSIPTPSRPGKNEFSVPLPAQMAAKAALYIALNDVAISKVELSRRLNCDEKEVRRLLDPHHQSRLPRIESALIALNKRLVVGLQPI